jgi:hypothetical protein
LYIDLWPGRQHDGGGSGCPFAPKTSILGKSNMKKKRLKMPMENSPEEALKE